MDCLRRLRDDVGVHRLLFGTNLPFIVPESPIMELGDARLPADEDAAVRYGKQLVALSSSTTSDRVALGDAYFKLGRTADAKAQYQKAASMGDATAKKRLAKLGCDTAQGDFISPPLDGLGVAKWLQQRGPGQVTQP